MNSQFQTLKLNNIVIAVDGSVEIKRIAETKDIVKKSINRA